MGKKRYVRVPKDKQAMIDYDYGVIKDEQMEQLILSEEQFLVLYNLGVFEAINRKCDIIDDYEEKILPTDKITAALDIVNEFIDKDKCHELVELRNMLSLAAEYKTVVGFDF